MFPCSFSRDFVFHCLVHWIGKSTRSNLVPCKCHNYERGTCMLFFSPLLHCLLLKDSCALSRLMPPHFHIPSIDKAGQHEGGRSACSLSTCFLLRRRKSPKEKESYRRKAIESTRDTLKLFHPT